ncbi:MAG: substrate-binding periplasmic protein [Bdellovibrionales bacterium]
MKVYILAILLGLFTLSSAHAETDSVYERIMASQTINCGYTEWPPLLVVDPNTHELSGLLKDLWEDIGKKLDLKIVWKASYGFGEVTEAVRTKKIDVFCVGVWPNSGRMKNMLMSRPVFYNATYLYARHDDMRFDNNENRLDDPAYTVVGQEGTVTASTLNLKFPKAKANHTAPITPKVDQLLSVVNRKGDVTLLDVAFANDYMKKNPGLVRRIKGPPVAFVPLVLPLNIGEYQLKNMIDGALNDLINDKIIAHLIQKYKAEETYAPNPDVKVPFGE